MSKEHPILFSTPMVQAILSGNKTQTRRIVKFPKKFNGNNVYDNGFNGLKYTFTDDVGNELVDRLFPKYEIGDILWVRETWCNINKPDYKPEYYYKTDTINTEDYISSEWKWKPSIFMPKEACRIKLKVTDIRAEQLQDISERDAIKEGVLYYGKESNDYKNYLYDDKYGDDWGVLTAKESYNTLWEKINGKESWNKNPWVWVIQFKKIEE